MRDLRLPANHFVLTFALLAALAACGDETPNDDTPVDLTRQLYVANSGANTITVIDVLTNAVTQTLTLDAPASSIRMHPYRSSFYAVQPSRDLVSKFLQMDSSVLSRIPTPRNPFALLFSDSVDAPLAYVTVQGSDRVDILRLAEDRILTSVPVGRGPTEMAIDFSVAQPGRLFVINRAAASVSVVNLAAFELIQTIQIGGDLQDVAFSGRANATSVAYVADAAAGVVRAIKLVDLTLDPAQNVAAGSQPSGLAMRGTSTTLLVTNSGDNTLHVIDTTMPDMRAVIPVGANPTEVLINALGNRAYVANTGGNSVTVVNLENNTVVATVPVGAAPRSMTFF